MSTCTETHTYYMYAHMQLLMEKQRFATVMWGGFDVIADAGGADPARQEWLMECTGLQVTDCHL